MPIDRDDPRLMFHPVHDNGKYRGVCMVYRDCSWLICPDRGLIFYQPLGVKRDISLASPQCNSNYDVSVMLRDKLYPCAKIITMSIVIMPYNITQEYI